MTAEPLTYGGSGVDVDIEALASAIMYRASARTWANRQGRLGEVVSLFDDFSGLRGFKIGGLPDVMIAGLDFDGTGTKIGLAERKGNYGTIGVDLVAMVAEDAARRGAEPIVAGTVLDVNTLGQDKSRLPAIEQIGESLVLGAKQANIAIVNGEIAQLSERVTGRMDPFGCIWNSGLLWLGLQGRLLDGSKVKPGDRLVGLREPGARSNGYSLLDKAFRQTYGDDWHLCDVDGHSLIEEALQASRIFTRAIVEMTGGCEPDRIPKARVSGIAHISGGGLPEKMIRMLRPSGYGAVVNKPFAPAWLMLHCQEIARVSDRMAYRSLCMGHGMVIATDDPGSVMAVAFDHGHEAEIIGYVRAEPGVRLRNHGFYAESEPWLEYEV